MHLNYYELNKNLTINCPHCNKFYYNITSDKDFKKYQYFIGRNFCEYFPFYINESDDTVYPYFFNTVFSSIISYAKCNNCNNYVYFILIDNFALCETYEIYNSLINHIPYECHSNISSYKIYVFNSNIDNNPLIPNEWFASKYIAGSYNLESHVLGPFECNNLDDYISEYERLDLSFEPPSSHIEFAILIEKLIRSYFSELFNKNFPIIFHNNDHFKHYNISGPSYFLDGVYSTI